jgi:hypothetical protein
LYLCLTTLLFIEMTPSGEPQTKNKPFSNTFSLLPLVSFQQSTPPHLLRLLILYLSNTFTLILHDELRKVNTRFQPLYTEQGVPGSSPTDHGALGNPAVLHGATQLPRRTHYQPSDMLPLITPMSYGMHGYLLVSRPLYKGTRGPRLFPHHYYGALGNPAV